MNLPTPYYDRDGIAIYNCDNRLILPQLKADLLLTDPPYGIGAARASFIGGRKTASTKGITRGKIIQPRRYGDDSWDDATPSQWIFDLMRENTQYQIIWGANYFDLPPSRCFLVWDKQNGTNDFADCELAWTNLDKAVRLIQHKWNGFIQQAGHREERCHPTQKPLRVAEWCIEQTPKTVQSILDPYCGSGTFLVAAKKHGKTAIGIEQSEEYCRIAVERIEKTQRLLFEAPITHHEVIPTEHFSLL